MAISFADLLISETKQAIYDKALVIAAELGLPVTTWTEGDPTRSTYWILAETLEYLEQVANQFFRSGFLDYAEGEWLKLLAEQVFGVIAVPATYATSSVVLRNTGGGVYPVDPGDIVLRSSLSGKTYRNTSGGTIPAQVGMTPGSLTIDVVADEAGSESSAAANEIDELVTTFIGVDVYTSTVAVGLDEESEASIRARCRAKVQGLSKAGGAPAYVAVATDPDLTTTTNVTKASVASDSTDGTVTVYLAGPSGAVAGADVTLVETAILEYATPLCITPTVTSASDLTIDIVYTLSCYSTVNLSAGEIATEVSNALSSMFAALPIGGDAGKLAKSKIVSTISGAVPSVYSVTVSLPVSDYTIAANQVAKKGTVTVSPAITITEAT